MKKNIVNKKPTRDSYLEESDVVQADGTWVTEWRWVAPDKEERFARQESRATATIRGSCLSKMFYHHGLPDIGSGSGVLDKVGLYLTEQDMLDKPGELLCSAESTLANRWPGSVYLLDVEPRGVARDYANLSDLPTVADSLARARLGMSRWEDMPASIDLNGEQASLKWVKTYKQIARLIGLEHTDIAAANLIFAQSKRMRALKTKWERLEDCMPAHQLLFDAIQPDLLWVTGKNFDILKDMWEPRELEWRLSGDGALKFGRGTIKFCGKWVDFAFTPSLSSWNAGAEPSREVLSWTFPHRIQTERPAVDARA